MQIVTINAENWRTTSDFLSALKSAIGAPAWHGGGLDAFIDSMIWHDEMNARKAPYTLKIVGLNKAEAAVREIASLYVQAINDAGQSDWGTDLEIRLVIEG